MSEKELIQDAAHGQRSPWRRWLWFSLVLCVLALAWATPWLLKWQLAHQLQMALHRPVVVQSLVLHPLSLSVELNGVSVANGHGGELLGWERLHLKASAQAWHERAAVLDEVQLHGLRVTATRLSDGRYDFDDLLQPQGSGSKSATRYAVHALSVQQARVAWRDANGPDVQTLAQLNVKGRVHALHGAPQGEFDLALSALNLAKLQAVLPMSLPVTLQQGEAGAQLHIEWAQPANEAPDVKAHGQVHVADVALQDKAAHTSLSLKTMQLQLDQLDLRQRTVKVSELVLDQAQVRLQLVAASPANAGNSAVVSQPSANGKGESSNEAAWQLALDTLTLQNGSLSFRDERVQPVFHARVAALNGTVQGLNTKADSQAQMQLNGTSSGSAPVAIQARLNPLAPEKFLELRAKVSNLELPRFSGYMGKYAGYAIEKGKGTMDVAYHLRNGQLQGENHVFIDQLTLGERVESPDATHLPVSLAIALLKNRQGQIELDLPVAGSMDDPQFSLGQVIGQAVWNLVTKVVTSPWTFLQTVFGGSEALSQAVFAPGSVELDAATRQTLDQLARAMHERPALTLEVRGVVDAARDTPAMTNLPKDEAARQEAFISLAQRRAQAVQRGLMDSGKVAPERVFVLAPKARHAEMPVNAGVVFTLR
jgi:outer membrane protein OmpA-like peptidoglycan-associated protein